MPHLQTPVSDGDHASGPADARVTLVEYGDYQCPDCGEAEPILREVRTRLGARLRFVYRDFPLTDLHEHALDAAVAAEFAARRGQFWPMHDLLLTRQDALTRDDLKGYAGRLGLDPEALAAAFSDEEILDRIREERQDGAASGVQGTPTLFLNGRRYDGPLDAEAILKAANA